MQFEKVKKEIINSKKRDFVQNHTFYAKKRDILQKVRNAVQKSIYKVEKVDKGLNNVTIYNLERWRFTKFIKSRPKYVLYCRFIPLKKVILNIFH